MKNTTKAGLKKSIFAPMSGTVVPLEQVPDEVFSKKLLGDGVAILPKEGKIYAPVDGEVATVAETLHAYGFLSKEGMEILIHVGLETVHLKGEGFISHVKAGDPVVKGDLIAEVDLDFLKSRDISAITPVVICNGAEDLDLQTADGEVTAGQDTLIVLKEKEIPATSDIAAETAVTDLPKEKKGISFDFLQKLGKVLMTVIAVMPAAGIMLSIGKLPQDRKSVV